MRPTQGRTLAVMQVSGGSQSFNAVNAMRLLGRWMRMVTIPNQSSVPKAFELFDPAGRLPAGPHYERLVDVCEELVRFTWLVRDNAAELVDRYSERMEQAGKAAAAARSIAEARTRMTVGRRRSADKGVVVSALGITQTLAWASTYYLTAVFADPVSADLHLSRTWFYGSVSAALLLSGLLGPLAGRMIDRHGGRDVLAATNLVFAAGLVLLSLADRPGQPGRRRGWCSASAWASACTRRRSRRSPGCMGARRATRSPASRCSPAFASTVGWPLSAALIDALRLARRLLAWAALHLLLGLPLNRLLVPKAPPPPAPSERVTPATADGVPWTMIVLAGVFGATWFVSTALAAHLPRLLEAMGATPAAAIAAGALVGPAQVAARVAEFGLLRRAAPMISARLAAGLHPLGRAAARDDRRARRHPVRAAARRRQRHADDRAGHLAARAVRCRRIRVADRPAGRAGPHPPGRRAAAVRPGARPRRPVRGAAADGHAHRACRCWRCCCFELRAKKPRRNRR